MLKFNKVFQNCIYLFFILLLMTLVFVQLFMSTSLYIDFSFLKLSGLNLNLLLLLDNISMIFMTSVLMISLAVFIFSEYYMESDKFFKGFHILVLIFVFSMLLLILSPNLLSGLIGWDGLGMSSYLLVIYYSNSKSFNSGMVTALTNRLGDILLLFSLGFMMGMGSYNIYNYSNMSLPWNMLWFLLIVASTTKSAQVPFSAWLPAAMAAPTPVSSLVHSSTLVTAGVYLLIRHEGWIGLDLGGMYLLLVGSLTVWLASWCALMETDLKKMIALSTLSQLGVMMIALSGGHVMISFFHLLSHAFFKALLFISAGVLIHNSDGYQDLRFSGSKYMNSSLSGGFMILGSFSLMGLPFMSAFYSKESILEMLLLNNMLLGGYILFMLSVLLTALYSVRLLYIVFMSFPRIKSLMYLNECVKLLIASMMFLFFPASLGGWYLSKVLSPSWQLATSASVSKLLLLCSIVLFSFLMIYLRNMKMKEGGHWGGFSLWGLNSISSSMFSEELVKTALFLIKSYDRGWDSAMKSLSSFSLINRTKISMIKVSVFVPLFLLMVWVTLFMFIYLCKIM